MDNDEFEDFKTMISNSYHFGLTLDDMYSCINMSETIDQFEAGMDATVALNDLIDDYYASPISDAMIDCYIQHSLGQLDAKTIAEIALEHDVEVGEIYKRLDSRKSDYKRTRRY